MRLRYATPSHFLIFHPTAPVMSAKTLIMRSTASEVAHDNIRDFETNLLHKICNDVEVEPPLQPLQGGTDDGLIGDDARPDIRAKSVWRNAQNAFFGVHVTNANGASQQHLSDEQMIRKHENDKKRDTMTK